MSRTRIGARLLIAAGAVVLAGVLWMQWHAVRAGSSR